MRSDACRQYDCPEYGRPSPRCGNAVRKTIAAWTQTMRERGAFTARCAELAGDARLQPGLRVRRLREHLFHACDDRARLEFVHAGMMVGAAAQWPQVARSTCNTGAHDSPFATVRSHPGRIRRTE